MSDSPHHASADNSYSVRFSNGPITFEVQGPDSGWVNEKLEELTALAEKSTPAPRISTPRATPSTSFSDPTPSTGVPAPVQELAASWDNDASTGLDAYVAQRRAAFDKGTTKQAAIVATYLEDTLDRKIIAPTDLEFVYRELGWPTINHAAQLNNAYARDKYFKKSGGAYLLTHTGRVYGRDLAKP